MRARLIVFGAVVATVTLASVAAAVPDAAKHRVSIDTKILPQGRFVLTPQQSGALKPDAGTVSGNWQSIAGRDVMRAGQKVTIYNALWTFAGKRGNLTIRERNEWVDVGGDANNDGAPDGVAVGTWKFVRGTGQYAGLTGGGRSGHEGLGHVWFARYEGFLVSP
jgi:hypothetical protein